MASNTWVFPQAKQWLADRSAGTPPLGTVDLESANMYVTLIMSSLTPATALSSYQDIADIVPYEATQALVGTTYTWGSFAATGRQAMPGTITWSVSGSESILATNTAVPQLTWATLTGAGVISYACLYHKLTNEASSLLIALYEFPTPITCNGGSVSLSWASGQFLKLTHVAV